MAETGQLPTSAFARLPFVEKASLSPNGENIAGLFGVNGEQRIMMMPVLGDRSQSVGARVPDQTEVAWIRWVGDDNIIVGLTTLMPVETSRWYVSRLIGISRKTGEITKLLWDLGGQNAADVLWIPEDGSTEILVAGQGSIYESAEFWPAVYRVDVATGRQKLVERGRTGVLDWGADNSGQVRLGIAYSDRTTTSKLFYRAQGNHSLREIDRARLDVDEDLTIPFFFGEADHGYIIRELEGGRSAVVETDITTGQDVRTIYADHDVEDVVMSPDGTKLLGIWATDVDEEIVWLDPGVATAQTDLQTAAPMAKARIVSFSADLGKMLVRFSTPDNPGLLYYYDNTTGDLYQLADANPAIGSKRLSRAKLVRYKARDGLEIEGVLTTPRGRAEKNLPMVVMPHGGPWAHDELTYDYWAQFLAERGYLVLQPNFRGSTGYGVEFEKAGRGQLGFAMQDDVTAGVNWAVSQGLADPQRVCIVGASYGGYAAMWGIAKDPDLYRCAISIAGVANLRREVNDFGDSIRARLYRGQWQAMTPDFAAVSPLNAVEKIKAPLLLIHGKKDVTVDYAQSDRMYSAMKKAGKTVDLVSLPQADHYFTREADRLTLLTSIEEFLTKYNPAD
ncbi:S9 family peptidase [Altererythrobacter sp. B11]|nr:S9 family peptidase [Altererythrobacter sp. B11]